MEFNEQGLTTILQNSKNKLDAKLNCPFRHSEKFKSLEASLSTYVDEYIITSFKTLFIKKVDIDTIVDDIYSNLKNALNSEDGINNNFLILSKDLQIIGKKVDQYEDRLDADNRCREISLNEGYVIFILKPKGKINFFIDGTSFGDSIFYTYAELYAYEEKHSMKDFEKVIELYREHLKLWDVYTKFFTPKSQLKSYAKTKGLPEKDFLAQNQHCLRSSPEDLFKGDLKVFLAQKLKIYVLTEVDLPNFDRLDIHFSDEYGEFYFIEVKWIGSSINANGDTISSYHTSTRDSEKAIEQCLRYLIELAKSSKNIKRGYLAVFDSRGEETITEVMDLDLNKLSDLEKKHYPLFKKLKHFRVRNTKPA